MYISKVKTLATYSFLTVLTEKVFLVSLLFFNLKQFRLEMHGTKLLEFSHFECFRLGLKYVLDLFCNNGA